MASVQAVAGGHAGYVRAVFSRRCRGFALPVDLVRANLRAVARVSVRRRVAAEFAGYLVTDAGSAAVPGVFSWRRSLHRPVLIVGAVRSLRLRCVKSRDFQGWARGEAESWSLDAHWKMPAGCMRSSRFGGFAGPAVVERGAWIAAQEVPAAVPLFSGNRAAHEYGVLTECVTGAGGVGFCNADMREGAGWPIDAPYALPAGSMRGAEFGGFSGVVQRGGK